MTYISQFPEAKLKPGAPIRVARSSDPSKVQAFGRGLEPEGLTTDDTTAEFTVDVSEAGFGSLNISVDSPGGSEDLVITDKGKGIFNCSYVPDSAGAYKINIDWGDQAVPGSPFMVNVAQGSDAYACTAYGPGLEGKDLKEGCETEFWVDTAGAGEGTLGITIKGPKGPISGDKYMRVEEDENDKYHVYYTAPMAGHYVIEIWFGGLHIAESPYNVHIARDRAVASKCWAEGDGITGKGVQVGKVSTFWVHTKGAGKGNMNIHIRSKSGTVPIKMIEKEPSLYECSYMPEEDGDYVITVKYGGENIPGSRFKTHVEPPTNSSRCFASGPGLEPQGVRVGIPTKFEVRTKDAGLGDLEVAILGPDGPLEYNCKTYPYTYDYTYEATSPGLYTVDVKFAGEHIPSSPYSVAVTDTSKVRIIGPGMKGEFLPINEPLEYFVDARGAGPGKVGCSVQGPMRPDNYDADAPVITDNEDGTFKIVYTPDDAGRLKMNATFAEAAIPDTPIKLYVYDASQVVANGKGLEDGNVSGELTHFTVDMRKGGEGRLHVGIDGPVRTPVTIKDQANNVVNCEYIPLEAGEYDINILWEGVHIPNSPYHIKVRPAVDPSAVLCYGEGLETGKLFTDMWAEFFIDTRKAGKGELQVQVTGPGGGEELEMEEVEDGVTKVRYFIDPDEAGTYRISVLFADTHVPGSLFTVAAAWKTDASKVHAYGPGLEGGITNNWAEFYLDMKKGGDGGLSLSIEGPCEAEAVVDDHNDGTATVKYLPTEPGEYCVTVLFADETIPSSPFKPVFVPCTDPSKVKAFGPGIEPYGVHLGEPAVFTVDTSEAGTGAVDVIVEGHLSEGEAQKRRVTSPTSLTPGSSTKKQNSLRRRSGAINILRPHITNNNDDTYGIQYAPRKVGPHHIFVTYEGVDIPNSPYLVHVTDPSKVKFKGPGVTAESVECVGNPLCYTLDASEAGPAEMKAYLDTPEDDHKDLKLEAVDDHNYKCQFTPKVPGQYSLHAEYAGVEIPSSPAEVMIVDPAKVEVTGDCFETPIRVDSEACFSVDATEAGNGELGLNLHGPVTVAMNSEQQDDGTFNFEFVPTMPGDYNIDATYAGKPIPGSPYIVSVYDPTKVEVSGPGVTGNGARVGEVAPVKVDTSKAGKALLEATVKTPSGEEVQMELTPSVESGVYNFDYLPEEPGVYEVDIKFGDEKIPKSPFQVPISDPDAVKILPPVLAEDVATEWVDNAESPPIFAFVDDTTTVDVFTEEAGPGVVTAKFDTVSGKDVPVDFGFVEVDPDHQQLQFTPHRPGEMELSFFYNDYQVGEARKVLISDPKACKAHGPGLEDGLKANEVTLFYVNTKDAGPGTVTCMISAPGDAEVACDVQKMKPDMYQATYTPFCAGNHKIAVNFAGGAITDSPFTVAVCDPSVVKAFGPGLESAIVGEETEFTIDATEAGQGELNITVDGPEGVQVSCNSVDEGLFQVSYTPVKAGMYSFSVQFAGTDVPGSQFPVRAVRPPPDASKCEVVGIHEAPGRFTVLAQDAGGCGLLEVGATSKYCPVQNVAVKHNGDYTFGVTYGLETEDEEATIYVRWHGEHVPGSPFTVYPK